MPEVASGQPLGEFRAVVTRDAEALRRHGAPFYALDRLPSLNGDWIAEVQFADGLWMLAAAEDLTLRSP